MPVRELRGSVAEHTADALLFSGFQDLEGPEAEALKIRYPDLEEHWNKFINNPQVTVGAVAPKDLQSGRVLLACLNVKDQTPGYPGIREVVKKVARNSKKLRVKTVACSRLGISSDRVTVDALEPVMTAAVGDHDLTLDFYVEFRVSE